MIAKAFLWLYLLSGLVSAALLVGLIAIVVMNTAEVTDVRVSAMPMVISMAVMLVSKMIGSLLMRRSQHG